MMLQLFFVPFEGHSYFTISFEHFRVKISSVSNLHLFKVMRMEVKACEIKIYEFS